MTREQLNKLYELSADITKYGELASENLKTAKDRYSHVTHKVERGDKEVEITEKVLWDEVFHIGLKGHEAADILRGKYPEIFEYSEKKDELARELEIYCITELGVNYRQLSIGDYLRLTEGVVSLIIAEHLESKQK